MKCTERDHTDYIVIIKLELKQLGAPLERNMYMEVPCQQMCNGHEHVCLGAAVTSIFWLLFFWGGNDNDRCTGLELVVAAKMKADD